MALRDTRHRAGMTGAEMAASIQRLSGRRWHQTKVSKLEGGAQWPTEQDIRDWAAAVDADPARLLGFWQRAQAEYETWQDAHRRAGGAGAYQRNLAVFEARQDRIAMFETVIIPGMVQTADYMRALLVNPAGPARGAGVDVDRLVAQRIDRQAVLHDRARRVQVVMLEAALWTLWVPPEVMRGQLDWLAALAVRPGLEVGVVPSAVVVPASPLAGFALYDDVVIIELPLGDQTLSDPGQVAQYEELMAELQGAAVFGGAVGKLTRAAATNLPG